MLLLLLLVVVVVVVVVLVVVVWRNVFMCFADLCYVIAIALRRLVVVVACTTLFWCHIGWHRVQTCRRRQDVLQVLATKSTSAMRRFIRSAHTAAVIVCTRATRWFEYTVTVLCIIFALRLWAWLPWLSVYFAKRWEVLKI
jgi:hypothetical protein